MVKLLSKLIISNVGINMTTLFEQFKVLKDTTDKLKSVVNELNEINGFNKLIIKGYTPRFNDGDVCEHTSDVYYSCSLQ